MANSCLSKVMFNGLFKGETCLCVTDTIMTELQQFCVLFFKESCSLSFYI
uniref:Uncharacterized protein n=1 Tax=Anguilla anguilla TaxID=7936 RepID=A0A0E9WNI8_ANGAN